MLFPRVGRQQLGMRVAWWSVVVLLVIGIILHLLPFYFMIITSFKQGTEILQMPPTIFPKDPTLAAWKLVFEVATGSPTLTNLLNEPLWVYFWNSTFMAFMTLLIGIPITSMAAYANSKLQRGPVARWLFLFFIGTLMVPAALTLIPAFLLTRNFPFALPEAPHIPGSEERFPIIRIWDTPWAVILPGVFSAFSFLLFKGFFDTIPDSIIQAARVDGGSEFNIFRRIVLPMSVPVYAVAIWTQFSATWDSFLWPIVVLQSTDKQPASVAIYQLMTRFTQAGSTNADQAFGNSQAMREILEAGLSWNGLMVLGLLQTLPVFILFIVCREYLLRGIRIRGLK